MNFKMFTENLPQRTVCGMLVLAALSGAGCATMGHEFPAGQVQAIRIGETTENDIFRTFGNPYRTGLENGLKTWTYGHYRYSAFEESEAEDLVIKFDKRGVVSAFTYNSTKRSK